MFCLYTNDTDWENLITEHSNNVDYEWYICQSFTGKYNGFNCCPTCTIMACKWANNFKICRNCTSEIFAFFIYLFFIVFQLVMQR